jgi:hypothetical protein
MFILFHRFLLSHCLLKMPRYTIAEKIVLLEEYFKTGSFNASRNALAIRFPHAQVPSNSTILRLVNKFRASGSVTSKERAQPRGPHVLMAEKVAEIQADILSTPSLSVRRLAKQSGVSKTSVHKLLRVELGMYPYRVTLTHQLLPRDHETRAFFCEWISNVVENDPNFLGHCFFSDEAWFHLDGYVNSQNSRQWSQANPHLIIEKPLHPAKVGVWAAMSATRIFFLFFETTVNANVYCNFIHQFAATLTQDEIFSGWFQQDNATAHTAAVSLRLVNQYFGERVISRGLWPARSPDLSPPDYFLWGFLKDKVYSNAPKTLNELRENITATVTSITCGMLCNAVNSIFHRANMCIQAGGQHFQHL